MKKILIFLSLILVVLIGFSLFFWLYEVQFFTTRAGVTRSSFSVDNSYLFVTPLRARANGQEKVRLTIFILNNQGIGVMGKKVVITEDPSLVIDTIQGLSDSYGKAFFDVSAKQAGEYYLQVAVDNTALNQKAHLSFY